MSRIRVLDDHLINRIAAGEVVERPASVVKELVENSLDAGARSIEVEVAAGGKRRIAVRDDGAGMERDDALLALERHATSKLVRFEDLEAVSTLGFRGEALPSIAAVSRFRLVTAARDGVGTEIRVRGGRIESVRDTGGPRGTAVEAASLFFNVPARRKFLRSEATELSHVARFVTQFALAHPSVRFRLVQEGRALIEAPRASDPAERVGQLYGRELAGRLVPFRSERDAILASGFAGRPVDGLPRRDGQHLFVNGRLVRDRVLAHAIQEAYGDTMPRGRYPVVLLFVRIPPSEVDVNVHPQKGEVRFARSSAVHDLVREAVGGALARNGAVPSLDELRRPEGGGPARALSEATLAYLDATASGSAVPPRWATPPVATEGTSAPPRLEERGTVAALAQFRRSYIVAEDEEGLLLVDQHVAHERVLYERFLAQAEEDRVEVQRLLLPRVVELSPDDAVVLEEEAGELLRLGFLIEPFGERAFRIDAVPAVASGLDPESLLRSLLGEAARVRTATTAVAEVRRRMVTTAACQAAIKVHYPLAQEAMQRLLDDLFRTRNPTTCPHGRPILFRLSLEEIERVFRRR